MPMNRLVGEAYILMRADGTLIPRDIKSVGKKAGKGYAKEFDKALSEAEKGSVARFRRTLAQATADMDFSRFRKEFGTVDDTVAGVKDRLKEMRREGYITASAAKRVRAELNQWARAERGIAAAAKEVSDQNKSLKQFFSDQSTGLKRITKARQEELVVMRKAREEEEKRLIAMRNRSLTNFFKNQTQNLLGLDKARMAEEERLISGRNKSLNQFFRTQNSNLVTLNRNREKEIASIRSSGREIERHASRWVNGFRRMHIGLDRASRSIDIFGDGVGRAFGKGSRNNFVNWVGSVVGGLTKLTLAVGVFPFRLVGKIGDSFGTAFSAARANGINIFSSSLKGLSAVIGGPGGLLSIVVGAGAGAFALGKLLPGIVSLLTQLGGVVTALVGSIGIGLTGALLAATPAAIGATAAFGGVFGVISAFAKDKDNKKFWDSIFTNPLKKTAKEFYPQIRDFLKNIRSGFKRLLTDVSPGIKTFFDTFKTKMNDKTTLAALDAWSTSIGKISVTLNGAVTSALSGLLGFFKPILPYAERLATAIANAASRFDSWANGQPGQNAIADFMKNAYTNAKLVWDILKEIGSIFGTVFSSGDENAGQSFLEGIRKKLAEIDEFLKTPDGRSKLDNFFGDVKDIGKSIGDLALSIGDIVKKLNDPNARESAKTIMDAFVAISKLGSDLASVAEEVGRIIGFMTAPATMAALELIRGIKGAVTNNTKPAAPGSIQGTVDGPTINFQTSINGKTYTGLFENAVTSHLGLTPGQTKQLATYVVDTDLDTKTYNATKRIVEDFRFKDKKVPIKGNEAAWNATKGTVAGYAFKAKVVPIEVADKKVTDWIAWWNKVNLNKVATIRYTTAGKLPNGGTDKRGGSTAMARGGTLFGPKYILAGEAGPEAIVPLRRPLHMVDPSVRALSAIAQGLKPPAMASGGIASGQSQPAVIIGEGAVKVVTQASDPGVVAKVVLHGIGDALAGAIG